MFGAKQLSMSCAWAFCAVALLKMGRFRVAIYRIAAGRPPFYYAITTEAGCFWFMQWLD
jgi:hypothetical protein